MYQEQIKPILKKVVKGYARDCWWSLYGRTLRRSDPQQPVKSMLFICKGNICRSPFAEHIVGLATEFNDLEVSSAGLHVTQPLGSPVEAISAASTFGVDLSNHTSQQVNKKIVKSFDMVLAMETSQYNALRKIFPEYRDKIYLLPLFCPHENRCWRRYNYYNIPDPYGKYVDVFEDCFERIRDCVQNLMYNCVDTFGSDYQK